MSKQNCCGKTGCCTGPMGPQGVQGPAGPIGADGPRGPQGPAGVVTPAKAVRNATSLEDIVEQFNQLLAHLRAAGLLKLE